MDTDNLAAGPISTQSGLPDMMQKTEMKQAVQEKAIQATTRRTETSDNIPMMCPIACVNTCTADTRPTKFPLIPPTTSEVAMEYTSSTYNKPIPDTKSALIEHNSIDLGDGPYKTADTFGSYPKAEVKSVQFLANSPTVPEAAASKGKVSSGDKYPIEIHVNKAITTTKPIGKDKSPITQIPEGISTMLIKTLKTEAVTMMQTPKGEPHHAPQTNQEWSLTPESPDDKTSVMQVSRSNISMALPTSEDKTHQIIYSNDSDSAYEARPKTGINQHNSITHQRCQVSPVRCQNVGATDACYGPEVITSPRVSSNTAAGSCNTKAKEFSLPTADSIKDQAYETTFDGASGPKNEMPLAESPVAAQQEPSVQKGCNTRSDITCATETYGPALAKLPESKQIPPIEKLEVVVAHYDENLHWLYPFLNHPDVKVSIYSKSGKNLAPELHIHTTYLDNIGREGHTYLYHIITRYDSLSKVILFCLGNPFNHFHVDYTPEELLKDALGTPRLSFVTFKGQQMVLFDEWEGIEMKGNLYSRKWNKMAVKPAARTPAEYWSLFMEPRGYKVPEAIGFAAGANFSVQTHMIQQFPKAFWTQMFSEFFLGPMEDINPMTGYICERFWAAIFIPESFSMYPGDIAHTVKHDMRFGRLTRGNWKVLPKDPKEFIPRATPHDLAIVLGIDTLDKNIVNLSFCGHKNPMNFERKTGTDLMKAREIHKKAQITISSGESSDF